MRNKSFLAASCLAVMFYGGAATANEPEGCTPAKQLVDAATAFYGNQPELTNIIDPQMLVGLKGINGYPDPSQLIYRLDDVEYTLDIVDGQVRGLDAAANWSKEGEICSLYEDGPIGKTEEAAVSLSVDFAFLYHRTDGQFTIDEIKEGAKDGSKVFKSLAPKGLGFAVPGLKTFAVAPAKTNPALPNIVFLKQGETKSVPIYTQAKTQFVRLKDLKSAKIDEVKIEGLHSASAFFKIDPDKLAKGETDGLGKDAVPLASDKPESN